MSILTIDYKDFLSGESDYDWVPDKGFSPLSWGINPLLEPGVLNLGWTVTDHGGATMTGSVIASTYDKTFLGYDNYLLDEDGCFYTFVSGILTKRQTADASAGAFSIGTTDMIQFKGNVYATSATRVVELKGSDLTSAWDGGWWSGLSDGYRHPLEVVEDTMYIGDINVVYAWNGTTSTTAVTLPTDCNITSLRRHPDGTHLIAFTGYTANFSHTKGGPGKIYIINKNLQTWEREILLPSQVEGSININGIIYVTCGKNVGYFTGDGIKFFKKLTTSTSTYSNCLARYEQFLIIRDGKYVLIYGDVAGRGNAWYKIYLTAQEITSVVYSGGGEILTSFPDGAGHVLVGLTTALNGTVGQFVSKRYNFGQTVKIRRIEILHNAKASAGTFQVFVYGIDPDSNQENYTVNYPVGATPNKTRVEFDVTSDVFQFKIVPGNTGILAIKSIRLHHDPIN